MCHQNIRAPGQVRHGVEAPAHVSREADDTTGQLNAVTQCRQYRMMHGNSFHTDATVRIDLMLIQQFVGRGHGLGQDLVATPRIRVDEGTHVGIHAGILAEEAQEKLIGRREIVVAAGTDQHEITLSVGEKTTFDIGGKIGAVVDVKMTEQKQIQVFIARTRMLEVLHRTRPGIDHHSGPVIQP